MRLRQLLKSKIHRVTVTEADVNYIGSITMDQDLLERVDLWPGELVHVWNVTNGERFETYALAGEPGGGMIRINGAGAHKARPGDILIVAAFALTDEPVQPKVILVDEQNRYLSRFVETFMFEVRVEKTIACAHRLFDYNGPCESLHGHNYRIEVAYTGTELDRFGMLVDFTDIKKAFNTVLDTLDHTYLNDLPAFHDLSPSAENIAQHIFQELKRTPFDRASLDHVSVWETPTQVAVYREA